MGGGRCRLSFAASPFIKDRLAQLLRAQRPVACCRCLTTRAQCHRFLTSWADVSNWLPACLLPGWLVAERGGGACMLSRPCRDQGGAGRARRAGRAGGAGRAWWSVAQTQANRSARPPPARWHRHEQTDQQDHWLSDRSGLHQFCVRSRLARGRVVGGSDVGSTGLAASRCARRSSAAATNEARRAGRGAFPTALTTHIQCSLHRICKTESSVSSPVANDCR